ncbi:ECF RNA polymerase sigma factor SigR [Candidatus Phycosocius bacilliformis]|uniref:ECF RNA polymerase sigma factor SigR n=1 Tax=Candidatus Phycosocius bacilliformis TaxID=1445552 RepID=A0A2P2EBP7_9PROT|nr:sigma-70 family RNA polymerase sigma factor [Candidatus Phycosocius bacilliformis]GBF58478.1 ECF RNA polymerase sigma factor SigR [Candidatus Phycosocius bacilliformis]
MAGGLGLVADEAQLHSWMLGAQAGDPVATRQLLDGLAPRLRAFFRNKGARPEDAEDLVQETLIAIYTKRSMFDPEQRLLAWVYAIARYRMIDRWRRIGNRGLDLPIEDFEHALAAEETEAGDPKSDVAKLLQDLPEKQRVAIELVKLKELSIAEAAAQTGWSPSDIKISIHRGLKALMRLVGSTAKGA